VLGNDGLAMATVVAGGMVAATLALLFVARPHRMTDPERIPAAVPEPAVA
jgi:MFS transporter, DHA1 family, multidrug resistance protein